MSGVKNLCLAAVMMLGPAASAAAWPATAYTRIFHDARETLPPPLKQLLLDMEPVLDRTCTATSVAEASAQAIERFSDPEGDLAAAVDALREAGCAAAAMNDPDLDALVESHHTRFAVVFYGWHSSIRDRDLEAYLETRRSEMENLAARFERTSELPNRSDMVELSPEFGMASIAYSHAVTDVANVWLYIWISVNGAF